MSTRRTIMALCAIAALLAGAAEGARAAEEQTIDAFAAWQGRAQVYATGKSSAVASIALDVGYDSEAAFARAFKRFVGMPPAAWRRARSGMVSPPTSRQETGS